MEKRVVLSAALTFLVIVIFGAYINFEPERQAAAAQRQRQEAIERGVSLFAGLCSGCHGPRGEGKVGPAVAGGAYLQKRGLQAGDTSGLRLAENELRKTISRGVAKTVMPAWAVEEGGALNQEQILEIASLLLYGAGEDWQNAASLAPAPAAPAAGAPPAPSPGAPDLAAQGRQVYESKGCVACHGPKAEGGIGPALAGFNEAQILKQVRTPKGAMPAFPPDRLSDEEIKALAAFIESLSKK
ncbi:MAG: c-type cytochrome [Candidatus Methylomirabilis oxyfera]|nr:c-type cytochrome [Candidatus Methylomirabilis oxyfera]